MSERQIQRLEEIIQRQRKVITFAQSAWDEVREENTKLRRVIVELQIRLEQHGLSIEVPLPTEPNLEQQLKLPLEVP